MTASLGTVVHVDMPFETALERTRAALKTEGFGVLTEIDMRAAFKDKLGHDFRPYVILGACNPPLAYRALSDDPAMGLLLPCNITVEADGAERAVVRIINPLSLMAPDVIGPSPVIREVALDAQQRLARVAQLLNHKDAP